MEVTQRQTQEKKIHTLSPASVSLKITLAFFTLVSTVASLMLTGLNE